MLGLSINQYQVGSSECDAAVTGSCDLWCAGVFCGMLCCRDLAVIFGGLMQLSVLLPTLRHFRVINILGLFGTTFTAW
jgi:hypothetical protein